MDNKFILGAFIGATIGAAIALLYAPSPGCEMREQLAQKSKDTAERIGKAAKRTTEDAEESVNQYI